MAVSRSWYALIKSQHFINKHLSNLSHRYLLCIHDKGPLCDYKGPYFSLHYDNEVFDEYNIPEYPNEAASVHGCNGLICYNKANNPKQLYLWNPTVRKLKVLPTSPQDPNGRFCFGAFQLWFDSKTNDYKILRIIIYPNEATIVEFYSLKTNSWKLISDNAPVTLGIAFSNLPYVNGVWYWIAFTNGTYALISLNMENWMFQEVKTWITDIVSLTPINDRYLVILGYVDFTWCCSVSEVYDTRLNEFYIMVHGRHRMNRTALNGWMLIGVRNNGEFLLQNLINRSFEIVSCNVETGKINHFVPMFSHRLRQLLPYTESLALLNDADASTI